MASKLRTPVAFLFNADEPSFDMTYDAVAFRFVFRSILAHARNAEFRVRFGDILLHQLSQRITEVGLPGKGSSRTSSRITLQSDSLRRAALAWEFFDSATDGWSCLDAAKLFILTDKVNMCAVSVSSLLINECELINEELRNIRGYLGAMAIDLGNPLHTTLLCNWMIDIGFYRLGDFGLLQSTPEDPLPEPSQIEGWWSDLPFSRVYLASQEEAPPPCVQISLSSRGRHSQSVLEQNIANTHQERVAQALFQGSFSSRSQTNELVFKVGTTIQIDADALERKLRSYVLNMNHEKGKHKAILISMALGLSDNDWHYLATQIMLGIEHADVERVRESEHGVQYQATIKVRGRNGAEKPLLTAWITLDDGLLRLTTAYLAEPGASAVASPILEYVINRILTNDEDWQALYDAAHRAGRAASMAIVPVPMVVCDVEPLGGMDPLPEGRDVISEGLCGGAFICIDAGHPFSDWILTKKLGTRNKQAIEVYAQSDGQSVMRAEAYAKAFAGVISLHDVKCTIRTYLS